MPVATDRLEEAVPAAGQEAPEELTAEQKGEALRERIRKMPTLKREDRDKEKTAIEKEIVEAREQELPPEQREKPVATTEGQPSSAPTPTGTKKKFPVKFNGKIVEFDDDDNLLGLGTTGAVKHQAALRELKNRQLQEEMAEARGLVAQKDEEARVAKAEADALRKQVEEWQRKSTTSQAAPATVAKPTIEKPVRPKMPDLPKDISIWTPEHSEAFFNYQQGVATYEEKIDAYREALATTSQVATSTSLPADVQAKLDNYDKFQKEVEQERAARKSQKEHDKARKRIDDYWSGFDTFAAKTEAFRLPKKAREVHEEVLEWAAQVAAAKGIPIKKPLTVHDELTPSPEWQAYTSAALAVKYAYDTGDAATVAAAEGLDKPEGYEQYSKLAELQGALNRYQQTKGPGIDLEDAYLLQLKENGGLDSTISGLQAGAFSEGAARTAEALTRHTRAATALPPGGGASVETGTPSEQDLNWFNNELAPFERMRLVRGGDARAVKVVKWIESQRALAGE